MNRCKWCLHQRLILFVIRWCSLIDLVRMYIQLHMPSSSFPRAQVTIITNDGPLKDLLCLLFVSVNHGFQYSCMSLWNNTVWGVWHGGIYQNTIWKKLLTTRNVITKAAAAAATTEAKQQQSYLHFKSPLQVLVMRKIQCETRQGIMDLLFLPFIEHL
jgi:hypothetical protein